MSDHHDVDQQDPGHGAAGAGGGDLRAELMALTREARAWVAWVADSGVADLGCEAAPAELLAGLDAGAQPPARRQQRQPQQQQQRQRQQQQPQQQQPQQQRRQQRQQQQRQRNPPPQPPHATSPQAPALDPVERKRKLAMLAEEVAQCTKCRLHQSRTRTAFSRGSDDTHLVFVGEGPGYNEDQQGLPFVGKAGQLLDKMIGAMGYGRDEVYICNIVKCRPPDNRKPEPDEMRACLPYLQRQLELIDPKVIVTLGATGAQGLLNTSMGVTRMRGTWKLYRGRIPLMPTFHPAYLLRQPEKKREVWHDLQQVMKHLGKPIPSKKG